MKERPEDLVAKSSNAYYTYQYVKGSSTLAIYRSSVFDKRTKRLKISDNVLLKTAQEIDNGVYEADLGGGVYKKRIPLNNQGNSNGVRTIVFFKSGGHLFFFDGWAKSAVAGKGAKEIEDDALATYKEIAEVFLHYSDGKITELINAGKLKEVKPWAQI